MPHSSRFTGLKALLGRYSAKLLGTIPPKPLQKEPPNPLQRILLKPVQRAPPKPLTQEELEEAQARVSENILIASTRIGSLASLVILKVIKAQAGALTPMPVARSTADHISSLLKIFIMCIEFAYGASLDCVAEAASVIAYEDEVTAEMDADSVAARVKNSLKGPHANATVMAIANAQKTIMRAVADAFADHVAIAGSTESSVRELVSVLSTAASQAASTAASQTVCTGTDIAAFVDNDPPPPYTET
ncbi:hypothetical protein F4677DRAFT_463406 [Hypoxylon crocopeplum]|nr:hypothetical protein F4677DRAFT_463406 [Hypoxylon crocopeplum]